MYTIHIHLQQCDLVVSSSGLCQSWRPLLHRPLTPVAHRGEGALNCLESGALETQFSRRNLKILVGQSQTESQQSTAAHPEELLIFCGRPQLS